ncbi:hypothetical protein ACO0QE_002862 [Hanseniaspora vineae]
MTTLKDLKTIVQPYTKHKQLSIRESEDLTLDLLLNFSEEDAADAETLQKMGLLLTKKSYMDLIDERNINKKCGYPLCPSQVNRVTDLYSRKNSIMSKSNITNPYAYLTQYCSKWHSQCSQFYHIQLSDEALFSRIGEHLKIYEDENEYTDVELLEDMMEKNNRKDIVDLVSNLQQLRLSGDSEVNIETEQLAEMMEDFKIVEHNDPEFYGDYEKD